MKTSLQLSHLNKSYCGVPALRDVSFSVDTPQVVGLLGTNGAGKSTLMRIIAGYIPFESGTIEICGIRHNDDKADVRQFIGYLPENAPLPPALRVSEALKFAAQMHNLSGKALKCAVDEAIQRCELASVRDSITATLSKGYRHRLGLALAIIHHPQLLILDEPTDGLDPLQKLEARRLLRTLGEEAIVLVSTHIIEEIPQLCERTIILNAGELIYDGAPPQDLLAMLKNTDLKIAGGRK